MRISDWSSDVCFRSDAAAVVAGRHPPLRAERRVSRRAAAHRRGAEHPRLLRARRHHPLRRRAAELQFGPRRPVLHRSQRAEAGRGARSEEHTSELQSLIRISFALFCLKKKKQSKRKTKRTTRTYNIQSKPKTQM